MNEEELIASFYEDITIISEIPDDPVDWTAFYGGVVFVSPFIKKWEPLIRGLATDEFQIITAMCLNQLDMDLVYILINESESYRRWVKQFYIPLLRRVMGDLEDNDVKLKVDKDMNYETIIRHDNLINRGTIEERRPHMNDIDHVHDIMDELTPMICHGIKERGYTMRGKSIFRLDSELNLYV